MPNHPPAASVMKDPMTWLYPSIEPFNTGRLQVSPVHEIYFEESGNPEGKPVIFLHGGPGGGSDPKQRRFFHPHRYRIVNFDQRGCGRSTPYASLDANTTWDLVDDAKERKQIARRTLARFNMETPYKSFELHPKLCYCDR
jgi:proline iminopeptidase